jgi:fucose 4-O-acetylase-like acetyltransferase
VANRTKTLVKFHCFSKIAKSNMKNDAFLLPKSRISETYKKNEIEWILIAKGIGTILVVVGHFWPADSPVYWNEARRIIYTFHMPLFFFLSGWLYQYGKYSYRDLISAKMQRLLFPFATIAILFFIIKFIAGMVFDLENPVNYESIYTIIIDPFKSYVPPLWYLHSLFMIFAVYALLRRYSSDVFLLLLFIGLNIFLDTDVALYGKTLHNIPFFITGIILRNNELTLGRWLSGSVFAISVILAFFIISCYYLKDYFTSYISWEYPIVFIAGVCGALLTIIVSRKTEIFGKSSICALLRSIGLYSMSIYLFHTLFESATRIVLMQTFRELKLPFEFVLVIAVVAGLIFPPVLEKYLLRQNHITRKFILGLP